MKRRAVRERTVEWSGVVCKQHVLSRERTKYHFTKPHTIYNLSSVCVLFVVVVGEKRGRGGSFSVEVCRGVYWKHPFVKH
jgi:hypothetical protein